MQKVTFEGIEYTLTQAPYIDGQSGMTPYYRAMATDSNGDEYEVNWDVRDGWEDIEDDEDMVEDWDAPSSVEKV